MPKAGNYMKDTELMDSDLLLGTDVITGNTVNFPLGALRRFSSANKGLFPGPDGTIPLIQDGILYPSFLTNRIGVETHGSFTDRDGYIYVSGPLTLTVGDNAKGIFNNLAVGSILWIYDELQSHFSYKIVATFDAVASVIMVTEEFSDEDTIVFTEFCSVAIITDLGSTLPIPSGDGAGQVAPWAIGDNTDTIPGDKIPNIQFGDQEVFATTALRNAATQFTWHPGDRAVISSDGSVYLYTGVTDKTTTIDTDWTLLSNVEVPFGTGSMEVAEWANGASNTVIPYDKAPTVFGTLPTNTVDWAEGSNTDIIPQAKLPEVASVTKAVVDTALDENGIPTDEQYYAGNKVWTDLPTPPEADSVVNTNTDGIQPPDVKTWTGTATDYAALTPDGDVLYNITDDDGSPVTQLIVEAGANINVSATANDRQTVSLVNDVDTDSVTATTITGVNTTTTTLTTTGDTVIAMDTLNPDGTILDTTGRTLVVVTGEFTGTRDANTIYFELE